MSKLVYIIDDDQVYLKFMKNHFGQMEGYQVETYENGTTALQKLDNADPFMIILDHNLNDPAGNGLYYLGHIKKKKPSTPVLLITSDSTEAVKKSSLKNGAKHVIVKSDSFLVQLRTAIDEINHSKQKGFFSKLFS